MKIILLSGGSGKRLWPLSNDVRSKQFLRVLPGPSGERESMVQRVVRQIGDTISEADIIVATSETQADMMREHLRYNVNVVTEPSRRDTFPAIALAAGYLSKKLGLSPDETVVVMPCDPYTEAGYFDTIRRMAEMVEQGHSDMVLMGITPDAPSTKFGYIVPLNEDRSRVARFTEKPIMEVACKLLDEGAVWNGGVFAFRLGYLTSITDRYIKTDCFEELRSRYEELPKISFDYEVVEKAKSIGVAYYSGAWKDLGTWDALCKELGSDTLGKALIVNSPDTTVVNELDLPVITLGVKNLVVAVSADGILVAGKEAAEHIKKYV